jgi:hypothetical protein
MTTKRAILFLLFFLTLGLFWMSCSLKEYQKPTIRTGITHPIYVLGPRKIYDEKLAQGRKPPRFGPMGWFHNGSMVFRTEEDARRYMTRNFHAYPPSRTGVYWVSGDFELDTRCVADGSYVLSRTLLVEGLAETFNAPTPFQPESRNPAEAPGPTGMGMNTGTIPGPAPVQTGMGMGTGSAAIPGPAPAPVPVPGPVPAPIPDPVPGPVPAPAPGPIPVPGLTPAPVPGPAPTPVPAPAPAP